MVEALHSPDDGDEPTEGDAKKIWKDRKVGGKKATAEARWVRVEWSSSKSADPMPTLLLLCPKRYSLKNNKHYAWRVFETPSPEENLPGGNILEEPIPSS